MKIARVFFNGEERYGIVEGERVRFLAMLPFDEIVTTGETVPLAQVRLLAPTAPVNFYGVGFNYPDHLAQAIRGGPQLMVRRKVAMASVMDGGVSLEWKRGRQERS